MQQAQRSTDDEENWSTFGNASELAYGDANGNLEGMLPKASFTTSIQLRDQLQKSNRSRDRTGKSSPINL
jgi:hypothetical protein